MAPIGPSATLQDPNQPFDPVKNDYVGLESQVVVRPLMIKENIYFQMRTISRSGVPSDWTDIVRLTMNPDPDEPENPPSESLERMLCQEDSVVFIPGTIV